MPVIIFLMETKLAKDKGTGILKKGGFWNSSKVPQEALSGGLLLGWMRNQSFNIQYSSKHPIHANLLDKKGIEMLSKQSRISSNQTLNNSNRGALTRDGKT
ncbi:hypothetical protein CMV_015496 [Castanea mollissima]|uniref:Uncharacterized protein n=1 Tax=Castanea mollissima TaxID=60419 RepID=A0A8J4RA13_9ROSI|nr:hypothetical protein CMV_015496 [Castanea mollissima]